MIKIIQTKTLLEIYSYLETMENYLLGEHNHETDNIQKSEDKKLINETIRLKQLLSEYIN